MRIKTDTKTIIFSSIVAQIFIYMIILIIILGRSDSIGVIIFGILMMAVVGFVSNWVTKIFLNEYKSTLTVEDGILEYRRVDFEKEEYDIENIVSAIKTEVHSKVKITREYEDSKEENTIISVKVFLEIKCIGGEIVEIPTMKFKDSDIDLILKEMLRYNREIDVNELKVRKLRDNDNKVGSLVEKIVKEQDSKRSR